MSGLPIYYCTQEDHRPADTSLVVQRTYTRDVDANVFLEMVNNSETHKHYFVAYEPKSGSVKDWDPSSGKPNLGKRIGRCQVRIKQ